MVSRLVLGCGTVGHAILDGVADWSGSIYVLDADGERVETLRTGNVSATEADPTDPDAVAAVEEPIDVVIVAGDDAETNLEAAAVAREAYPDAALIAYTGSDPTQAIRDELAATADRVIDASEAIATRVLDVLGSDAAQRTRDIRQVLKGIDGKLGVFMHDNPDPDAIASAIALVRIAAAFGVDAEACYFGEITHQENRALVNLLDLSLRNVEPGADLSEFDAIALVDHSRPNVNSQLPQDTPVDIIVDHHRLKMPAEAQAVDLRTDVGATSTLLTDHLRRLEFEPDETVATALLYGIRVDTKDFTREVSQSDFESAAFLLPYADTGLLERVENPSMSAETLETIGRAIQNRIVRGSVLASCVGSLTDRDALAQAADRLLGLRNVNTTVVYGFTDETIYVSARSRRSELDLGEAVRDAFGQIGSAGGHADMAGAQIPLGLLGEVADDQADSLSDIVSETIRERFFEAVELVSGETGETKRASESVRIPSGTEVENESGSEVGGEGEDKVRGEGEDESESGSENEDESRNEEENGDVDPPVEEP